MPTASGVHYLSGTGDQQIDVGFQVDVMLIYFSNHGVLDTWELLGGVGGMGVVCRRNPGIDNAPASFSTHEIWYNNLASSSFLWNVATWSRQTNGGGTGWALYGIQLGLTAVRLRYSSGYEGGAGTPLYWIAFGSEDEFAAHYERFAQGENTYREVGLEPRVVFTTGSGAPLGADGSGSMTVADFSVPVWGVGIMGDEQETDIMYMDSMITFVSFSNVMLGDYGDNSMVCADATTAGTLFLIGSWSFWHSGTQFRVQVNPLGFASDNLRIGTAICGGIEGLQGAVVPSSTVGGEVMVELPLDLEAVILFSSDFDQEAFGNEVWGGRGFGYICKDGGQALVAQGGHAYDNQCMGRFQSDNQCWASNFSEGGLIGVNPSYGTGEIVPGGFKLTTTANGSPMKRVMYTALGYPADYSGFFEVLN